MRQKGSLYSTHDGMRNVYTIFVGKRSNEQSGSIKGADFID
jgi:hypothetical protein